MSEQSYINCLNYLFRRLTLLNLTLVYLEYFTILPLFWNQKFDKFKTAKIQTFSTSFCNIRPEDTYRRITKLSLKTTGQRLNRALHVFHRL